MDIISKRLKQGWRVTFWCEPTSVICQIFTPSGEVQESPTVDVAFPDFTSAVNFAIAVCRRKKVAVDAAGNAVENWFQMSGDAFLALLDKQLSNSDIEMLETMENHNKEIAANGRVPHRLLNTF